MIFHELAHQVAYAQGDTMFNVSFATSVEAIGGVGEGGHCRWGRLLPMIPHQ